MAVPCRCIFLCICRCRCSFVAFAEECIYDKRDVGKSYIETNMEYSIHAETVRAQNETAFTRPDSHYKYTIHTGQTKSNKTSHSRATPQPYTNHHHYHHTIATFHMRRNFEHELHKNHNLSTHTIYVEHVAIDLLCCACLMWFGLLCAVRCLLFHPLILYLCGFHGYYRLQCARVHTQITRKLIEIGVR